MLIRAQVVALRPLPYKSVSDRLSAEESSTVISDVGFLQMHAMTASSSQPNSPVMRSVSSVIVS